jgi:hypothetical protein
MIFNNRKGTTIEVPVELNDSREVTTWNVEGKQLNPAYGEVSAKAKAKIFDVPQHAWLLETCSIRKAIGVMEDGSFLIILPGCRAGKYGREHVALINDISIDFEYEGILYCSMALSNDTICSLSTKVTGLDSSYGSDPMVSNTRGLPIPLSLLREHAQGHNVL